MSEEFHRIQRLPPYVFEQVNKLKAAARDNGDDIIDFGMGNPDLPTPQHIIDKLVETVQNPRAHRYSASRGIPGLRRAQARYYARRFGVKLDPDREIIATLGSKEGFANMAQAMTDPGMSFWSPIRLILFMPLVLLFRGRRSGICQSRGRATFCRSLIALCKTAIRNRRPWC